MSINLVSILSLPYAESMKPVIIKLKLFFVAVLFTTTIGAQGANAEPIPNPTPADISQCRFYLGAGKKIPNKATSTQKPATITNLFVTGGKPYKIEFTNPIDATFNGRSSQAYKLTSQNIVAVPTPDNDYLWLYADTTFDGTSGPQADFNVIRIIFKSSRTGQWEASNISEGSVDTELRLFGRYVKWLNDNNGQTKCNVLSSDPGSAGSLYVADPDTKSQYNKTIVIKKLKSDGLTDSLWYFVARYNRNKVGEAFAVDYIYRKGESDSYLKVSEGGKVNGNYNGGSSPTDWKDEFVEVSDFVPPQPIISSSEVHNHLKLPSGPGSKIQVKFDPPLIDPLSNPSLPYDVSGKDKNITLEIQLNNANGAYTNKELVDIVDDPPGSGTYKNSDLSDGGINNDIYILDRKDIETLYFGPFAEAHDKALTKKVIVCAHKKLDKTGFSSGSVTLNLTDSNGFFSADGGSLKQIRTEGAVKDWTFNQETMIIPATKGAQQTCGSDDDVSVPNQIKEGLGNVAFDTQNLILKALGWVATIIQNFIVYVVSWAIGLASRSVPI